MNKATGNKSTTFFFTNKARSRDAKGRFTAKKELVSQISQLKAYSLNAYSVKAYSEKHPYLIGIVQAAFLYGFREAHALYQGIDEEIDEQAEMLLDLARLTPNPAAIRDDEGALAFESLYDRTYYGHGLKAVEACQRLAKSDEEREMIEALGFIARSVEEAKIDVFDDEETL